MGLRKIDTTQTITLDGVPGTMRLVRSGRTVQLSMELLMTETTGWTEIIPAGAIPAGLRPKVKFYSTLTTSTSGAKTSTITEHRTNGSVAVAPTQAGTYFGSVTWVI